MQMPVPVAAGTNVLYQEHDRIPLPEDVPVLGVRAGDEGIIRRLTYLNNTVFAFVRIDYSTGQTRGWIFMEIKPNLEVRSFTTATSEDALAVP